MIRNIAVVGGGNIGLCLAADLSLNSDIQVTVFTSKAKLFKSNLVVYDEEKKIRYISNKISFTKSLKKALSNDDIIFCTYPAFLRKKFISSSSRYIKTNCYLGFIPGYGGAEFFCSELIRKGVTVFGFQKPPYVSRINFKNLTINLMSRKKELLVATMPKKANVELSKIIENLLHIKVKILKNYFNVCLLPGNPLLHTSGSYIYSNKNKTNVFDHQIYYYREWNDDCSRIIFKMSGEMMSILKKISIDTSGIKSIPVYYESKTIKDLTKKFHQIPSFQNLLLPMKKTNKIYTIDYSSRFFTEDIPYGLVYIKSLALLTHNKTPYIDRIINWYQKIANKEYFCGNKLGKNIKEAMAVQNFGIKSVNELINFYNK